MMFHYLLELHQDGVPLGKIELNVPVESFPVAKTNAILIMENLLLEYGKRRTPSLSSPQTVL